METIQPACARSSGLALWHVDRQEDCYDFIVGTSSVRVHEYQSDSRERIINDEVKSAHFRSAEEVIAKAFVALREKERADDNGHHDDAVRERLNFVEKNRTPLHGVSVKQLIHEGHRL
ncbi:MAG: hypothetical protein WB762_12690 [Candidatus Sulfotelmatobacter sp.]